MANPLSRPAPGVGVRLYAWLYRPDLGSWPRRGGEACLDWLGETAAPHRPDRSGRCSRCGAFLG